MKRTELSSEWWLVVQAEIMGIATVVFLTIPLFENPLDFSFWNMHIII